MCFEIHIHSEYQNALAQGETDNKGHLYAIMQVNTFNSNKHQYECQLKVPVGVIKDVKVSA